MFLDVCPAFMVNPNRHSSMNYGSTKAWNACKLAKLRDGRNELSRRNMKPCVSPVA